MAKNPNAAPDALLLAKFQTAPLVGFAYSPTTILQDAVDAGLVALADADMLTINESFMGYSSVTLTTAGEALAATVTPSMLTGAQVSADKRAGAALWLWLVLNGEVNGSYGSKDAYGARGEIMHVLLCGLDLDKSSAVQDDVWTVWAGTFANANQIAGVSGNATCKCGEVRHLTITAQVESVTALLLQTLSFT